MAGLNFKNKSRMKRKKSQISMFVILGIVILVVVSLVLYLTKTVTIKPGQGSAARVQDLVFEPRPIKEFTNVCLEDMAKEAIFLLGRQGGYLFISQGGTVVDFPETDEGVMFVNYNNYRVVYNLLPPSPGFSIAPYSPDLPSYPWNTFPFESESSNEEIFEGFFGTVNMRPLTRLQGPHSIQSQIETFIERNIMDCLDFTSFAESFEIVVEEPEAEVIIANKDVSVRLKLPITISNPTTQERVSFDDFSTKLDVKLRDMYFFVKDLIKNDVQNIKFDISDRANNKASFNIDVVRDVYSSDDLITISDEKSLINGDPYKYSFARKNRAPALHYRKNNLFELWQQGHLITRQDLLQGEELKGYDPDEDPLDFDIKEHQLSVTFPVNLNRPVITFYAEVTDGKETDFQELIVKRKD